MKIKVWPYGAAPRVATTNKKETIMDLYTVQQLSSFIIDVAKFFRVTSKHYITNWSDNVSVILDASNIINPDIICIYLRPR
jgi:hypothetical protein